MTRIPNTKTVVSYAYTIRAGGKTIGTIQGFNPSYNRTLERVREIQNSIDDTVEIVPGRTEITLTIDRFETYDETTLSKFGAKSSGIDANDISEVTDPFTITEIIQDSLGNVRTVDYVDCWIQTYGKTIREGTINVAENVTIFPTRVRAR